MTPVVEVEFMLARLVLPHSSCFEIAGVTAAKAVAVVETSTGSSERVMLGALVAAPNPGHRLHSRCVHHVGVAA